MTIYDVIYVMDNHYNKIIIQNDGNDDPTYEPFVGTVDDFKNSELYDQIADAEVVDLYSENDGTIWICYFYEEDKEYTVSGYVDDDNPWS